MESVEERITELESKISNLELLINERFSEVMSAFNKFSESRDKSEGEESGVKSVGEASGNKNAGPTNSPEMESKQPSEGTSTHFPNFYTRFDKKLEMPTYVGEGDPTTWAFQVERYFGVNKLSESEKLEAAGVCLRGAALAWLQWEENRRPYLTWEELKGQLLQRFLPKRKGTQQQRLLSLRHTSSVVQYRNDFEALTIPLKHLDDETLVAVFLNGLEER